MTNAAAVMLMSSSRRLLTLYESIRRRAIRPLAMLRGKVIQRTISSGAITDFRYSAKKSLMGTVRSCRPSKVFFARSTSASSASRSGGMSAIGDAVTMLPASVARLRICLDAKTRSILSIIGYSPSSASSSAVSVAPPPTRQTPSSFSINESSCTPSVDTSNE